MPGLKKCDIVMKGGITSGIVYPGVVRKLAECYQFQSIGGTSAGAIAATLTAAAEYARRNAPSDADPFKEVRALAGWLGEDSPAGGGSNLFRLFQPQPGMEKLFRFATSFLTKGWRRRLLVWLRVFKLELLIGCMPGAALVYMASDASGWRQVAAVVLGSLLAVVGSVVAAVVGVVVRAARLPSHRYGLCLGYSPPRAGAPPSLVGWLDGRINAIAGKPAGEPLTFGDLASSGITLRMISTCLTFGRPFTLPFETAELLYSPDEMRLYFPEEVVAWMEAHPGEFKTSEDVDLGNLKPLPDREHLPVIFAARLSLSFPVLFTAVPLYAIDWTRRDLEARKPERVWFSDGGICSNFPIHMFDSPAPRWPTFGVDLRELRPDQDPSANRTWIPNSNSSGIGNLWNRLPTAPGLAGGGKFVGAIFDAARNWVDNLQTTIPGYRDRVVHIYLDGREGGLNLNMPKELVDRLANYGGEAADRLIDHFLLGVDNAQPTRMTWDNHRWVRYRSTMAQVERFLSDFSFAIANPEPGDRTYPELAARGPDDPPDSYRMTGAQRERALRWTGELGGLGVEGAACVLQGGAPRPNPELRVRPKF